MYLWNTRALAKELKEETVSQSQRFKYFLVFTMLYTTILVVGHYVDRYDITPESVTNSVLTLLVTLIGTIWCYRANGGRNGHEFIDRSICLGLPIGIRLIVVMIFILILYFIVGSIIYGEAFFLSTKIPNWLDVTIGALIQIAFIWRLAVHLRWIASESPELPTIKVDDQTLV